MRSTFFDAQVQQVLEHDGFAVIPFLDADEVATLRASYDRLGRAPGDPGKACISTFHTYDADYKAATSEAILEIFRPHIEATFDRQRIIPCNFLVKWPGAASGFGLHQDLSLVDEREHRSVEVWVALEDTNDQNGQLWFAPGSQSWVPTLRGIQMFPFAYGNVARRIIDRHSVPVPLKAGEAIVFNHATVHFSMPNRTDVPRLVAITDLIPVEAPHLHFFGDGRGAVDAYEIDESFWVDNNPFTLFTPPAAARNLGRVDWFEYVECTDAILDRMVAEGRAVESTENPRGAVNSVKPWCHRCGGSEGVDELPDRWVGNTTFLCTTCAALEANRSKAPAPV